MTTLARRLGTRTRLTLWYVALLAGTLAGLIGLGLWLVQHQLYANADQLLRSKAAAVATEIDVSTRGRIMFDAGDAESGETPAIVVGLDTVRIFAANRRVVYRYGPSLGTSELLPEALDAVLVGEDRFETVQVDGGGPFRLLARAITEKGKAVGVIQVGRSQGDVDTVVTQMRLFGLMGLLLGLVVAWVGGSFLASRVLRPVDRIREAAEQIGAHDLSLRLAPPTNEDELGKLTLAFNKMIERLDTAFQQQQRFTADASHELRTPLTVIRSLSEVALASPRNEGYDRRVYTSICDESERLGRLVESLLVLARADQGQPLVLVPLDLDEVILDAAERVAARARTRGVLLRVELTDGEQVAGDANWLTQLLLNLLDNALRHTPAGGQVTLAARLAGRDVVLSVADTGDGIDPQHLLRIFDRFYRVDDARSRATGGFGLGLAICQWIVQAHHGTLTVRSELGFGTTFEARLPHAPQPPKPAGAQDANTSERKQPVLTRGRA